MVSGGCVTVLEGIVGPWSLDLVLAHAPETGVHYVVLRPSLDVVVARATARAGEERVPGHPALTDESVDRELWQRFAVLGPYEQHELDNSATDAEQTAQQVCSLVAQGKLRLTSSS